MSGSFASMWLGVKMSMRSNVPCRRWVLQQRFWRLRVGDGAGFQDFERAHALLVGVFEKLLDAMSVTAAVEWRREKDVDEPFDHLPPREPLGEREHICVVVTACEFGRQRFEDRRAAGAGNFICGHRDAQTRAAHNDTVFGLTARDRLTDGVAVLRIVDRRCVVRAEIQHGMTARAQEVGDAVLVVEAGVISGKSNRHSAKGSSWSGRRSDAES